LPEANGPTRVVTFYSYKGGVGRTMALVNTAAALAQRGMRVLLVDFDLEAPGMTHFFAEEVRRRREQVHKDSLDLLLDAKHSLEEADGESREPVYPCSLAEYIIPLSLPDAWIEKAPQGIPYRNGRMDLIPATLEPERSTDGAEERLPSDYLERLQELDLGSLFLPGGPGHRFGAHVRGYFCSARFEAPGDILFALRDSVQAAYDLVLIDSRTGLNEVAGFSIGTVADALVICCGLNQQNIAGTSYFMKKTGLLDRERAKPFLVVLGPVPPWQSSEVAQRRQDLKRALQQAGDETAPFDRPALVEIPYHPLAALSETLFVINLPTDTIAQAYQKLADRLLSQLSPGPASENAEWQLLSLALIEDPGDATWKTYGHALAGRLPRLRLTDSQRLSLPTFPSACGLHALPRKRSEVTWESLEQIPPVAAIAAGKMKSSAPFERAWEFLLPLPFELQGFLARGLICFQSATLHLIPQEALSYLRFESKRERHHDFWLVLSDLNAYLGGLRLASYQPTRYPNVIQGPSLEDGLVRWSSSFPAIWRWSSDEACSSPEILRAVEHWAGGTLGQASESLRALRVHYRLPVDPATILRGKLHWEKLGRPVLDIFSAPTLTPFGFWPEPLAATVAALQEGTDAIDEILAWLHLARLYYGYTWRVRVDWRYFEHVYQHPRFQAFLQEEAELVEEIEVAIDRGEYPL
jgi:cellulose biosynthesis protein BcsQ